MKPSDDYEGVKPERVVESDYDGAEIIRPSTKVTTFTPGGYFEANTTDVDVQKNRVEKASTLPLKKKAPAKKKTPAKKKPTAQN